MNKITFYTSAINQAAVPKSFYENPGMAWSFGPKIKRVKGACWKNTGDFGENRGYDINCSSTLRISSKYRGL